MIILAIAFITLGLMAGGFVFHRMALMFGAAGFWIVLSVLFYNMSSAIWDVYFVSFWFSIGMGIVTALLAMVVREKTDTPDSDSAWGDDEYFEEQHRRQIAHQRHLQKYDELTSGRYKGSVWDDPEDDRRKRK